MVPREFSEEERAKALKDSYNQQGKGSGMYYMLDEDELKEYNIKKFTPKPGNVFLAILPRPDDPKFFQEIYVHYRIGPNNYAFLCPNKMYEEDCPVCNRRKELAAADEPDEVLDLYSRRKRVLFWVVNVENTRAVEEGVYLYDAPNRILKSLIEQTRDTRTGEIIDISSPTAALELQFTREGKDSHTQYGGFKVNPRDASIQIPAVFYEDPIDMVDLLIPPDVEKMRKALGVSTSGGGTDRGYDDGRSVPATRPLERDSRPPERASEDKGYDDSRLPERAPERDLRPSERGGNERPFERDSSSSRDSSRRDVPEPRRDEPSSRPSERDSGIVQETRAPEKNQDAFPSDEIADRRVKVKERLRLNKEKRDNAGQDKPF